MLLSGAWGNLHSLNLSSLRIYTPHGGIKHPPSVPLFSKSLMYLSVLES